MPKNFNQFPSMWVDQFVSWTEVHIPITFSSPDWSNTYLKYLSILINQSVLQCKVYIDIFTNVYHVYNFITSINFQNSNGKIKIIIINKLISIQTNLSYLTYFSVDHVQLKHRFSGQWFQKGSRLFELFFYYEWQHHPTISLIIVLQVVVKVV